MTWTDERRATVKRLWKDGLSATQIIPELGHPYVTRNAVIGLIHRAGMTREDPQGRFIPRKPRAPATIVDIRQIKNPLGRKSGGVRPVRSTVLVPALVAANPVALPEPASLCIQILDLLPRHCRWPSDEAPFTYCGTPHAAGSVYCLHHDGRAYNEKPPRKRRGGA